jgi:hypothetical protein
MEKTPESHNELSQPHVIHGSFSLKIFFLCFIILVLIFAGIIAIGKNKKFTIEHVEIVGVKTFASDDVLEYVNKYLEQSAFKVFPRSSSLFFSKHSLQQSLKKEFPIVDLGYVSFVDPHTIRITIRERNPESVWCFAEYNCGFIDRLGILYGKSPQFSDGVYTIFSSEELKTFDEYYGKEIIKPEMMYRFSQLFSQLQTEDIIISQVKFLSDRDISFIIEKLFNKYPQKLTPIRGTINQNDTIFLRDVFTGLDHEVFKKQFLDSPKDLEYIDLRFPGKIFYKFKGKEKPLERIAPEVNVENVQQEIHNDNMR